MWNTIKQELLFQVGVIGTYFLILIAIIAVAGFYRISKGVFGYYGTIVLFAIIVIIIGMAIILFGNKRRDIWAENFTLFIIEGLVCLFGFIAYLLTNRDFIFWVVIILIVSLIILGVAVVINARRRKKQGSG